VKVLLIITGLGVGGAERLVTNLADEFSWAGHQVVLVFLNGECELPPKNDQVRLVNLGIRKDLFSLIKGLQKLRLIIREMQPDVVNSHLVHANIITRILRLFTSMKRLICSAHNTNEEGRFRMLAYRLTDRLADISTNVSQEAVVAFEQQRALRPGRMLAIHNGINTQNFVFDASARTQLRKTLAVDDSMPLLLAVGRLWEQKDYPNLLKAFANLKSEPVLPQLVIIGDGPLRSEFEEMARALGIADRVRFLGIRHDIAALMCACDVFVLSSAWEGFGLVVAEAMACERVVVATDCGGVKEVVGDVGYLVPPRDSDSLCLALQQALRLPLNERTRLGFDARERVIKKFSLESTANHYLAVYNGQILQHAHEGDN
jgi:glycosyltransferase involved in cell wall biosynthesis